MTSGFSPNGTTKGPLLSAFFPNRKPLPKKVPRKATPGKILNTDVDVIKKRKQKRTSSSARAVLGGASGSTETGRSKLLG